MINSLNNNTHLSVKVYPSLLIYSVRYSYTAEINELKVYGFPFLSKPRFCLM